MIYGLTYKEGNYEHSTEEIQGMISKLMSEQCGWANEGVATFKNPSIANKNFDSMVGEKTASIYAVECMLDGGKRVYVYGNFFSMGGNCRDLIRTYIPKTITEESLKECISVFAAEVENKILDSLMVRVFNEDKKSVSNDSPSCDM